MLILLGAAVALELLVHLVSRWAVLRTITAWLALLSGTFAAGAFLAYRPNVFTLGLTILGLYRIFNLIRIAEHRMHEQYLRRATRRTTFKLIGLQAVLGAAWWGWEHWQAADQTVWSIVGLSQVLAASILLYATIRNLKKTAWPTRRKSYSDKELPTVTVAIPARNETEDLHQCLQSVIASDYPKLEVVVLDDCSQTKRTPEIIRQFAHAGVRFVQGREPSEAWLPKNEAYARLAEEASGAYVLFCGVDVRFGPSDVRTLMATMLERNKQMMCVMPRRKLEFYGHFSLIQAMRYWWELALPRRTFNRPPVLSTCWVINLQALERLGSFKAVARSIVPEAHFARELTKTDGYSFLRAGDGLYIETTKRLADQRETAVRMRYPQMHRRPEQVALTALLELAFLVLPFVLAIGGFWLSIGLLAHVTAVVASLMLIVAYELIVLSSRVNTWWFGLFAQPFAVLSDIVLLHYSMWKYEFSTVDWKGRNVCIPVMHVVPRLPDA